MKTIGVSSVENEIADFYQQGKLWIATHCGDRDMFAEAEKEREEKQVVEYLLSNMEQQQYECSHRNQRHGYRGENRYGENYRTGA